MTALAEVRTPAPTLLGFGKATYRLVGTGSAAPIQVDGRAPGVLAIHGFTGVPNEVRVVTEAAGALGLRALAPLLPGHGTDAHALQATTWSDWVEAASAALDEVSGGGPAIVAGMSLGSVLATHLAATRPDRVRALVVLGCAAWLPALTAAWPLSVIDLLGLSRRDLYLSKGGGADIADAAARAAHVSYDVHPVRAAVELWRFGRIVRRELARVRCPTLVMHGRRDRVCPPANAHRLASALGTPESEVVLLDRSAHIITVDRERDRVAERLEAFFRRVS